MIRNIWPRATRQCGQFRKETDFSKIVKRSRSMQIHEVPFPAPDDGPLKGLRVLDLTRILAGPYCTMILGDLGAEIIKVERPGHGDDTRTWSPPEVADMSCYFVSVNRNKKSIVLDMKRGGDILRDLVKQSDILVENYVPGTLEKLGLGYDDLREVASST
ncbi:unnamed protein product [Allacma fusca]|uniref:Uncharacterized protein n=1 Tax=Allacma fusca TaxID=39272 RepID=A0A8J2L021_9HEXA|nr:unnamed protein product [Allacma fusca]